MSFNAFTVVSQSGFYDYPQPEGSPFSLRLTLKGVSADEQIVRMADEGPLTLLAQVHGTRVLSASQAARFPQKDQADGLLIRPGDGTCGLRFADCAPVVILSLSERPWLLALHSGFRGTLGNITASAMKFVASRNGAPDPDGLYAWVGPCVCGKCYSRRRDDPTTSEALGRFVPEACAKQKEFVLFDLKRQIAQQLLDVGVPRQRIFLESQCTYEQEELFYSHRRWAEEKKGKDRRMLLTIKTKSQPDGVIINKSAVQF
ncbi:MAG: polyphenol oxidase family protein [Pyramidobacter sp.]|jgi:YfiH family protein